MSKRSNRGKGYFHAMGQRDKLCGRSWRFQLLRVQLLPSWATHEWWRGYNGF